MSEFCDDRFEWQFEAEVARNWRMADWGGLRVAVACSGGPDSVALLAATVRACPPSSAVVVLHFNHQLRGEQSNADEAFVAQQAERFACPCFIARADGSATMDWAFRSERARHCRAGESAWRTDRYAFLAAAASALGIRYVALAHNRDDQVETLLHNLFRGGGLAGLAGMKTFRELEFESEVILARPMLTISRADVLRYLEARQLSFRCDPSNEDTRLARNWIRHDLLPQLERRYGDPLRKRLFATSQTLAEIRDWIDAQALRWIESQGVQCNPSGFELKAGEIAAVPWPVAIEVLRRCWTSCQWGLRDMNHEHWLSIRHLIQSPSGDGQIRLSLPGTVYTQRVHGRLCFNKQPSDSD